MGFDLLPYSLKSSHSIYVFCFALSEPHFPCKVAYVVFESPF